MKLVLCIFLLMVTVGYGLDITTGGAYYTDDDLHCAALYTQLPLIELDQLKLGLGIVIPLVRENQEFFGGRSCPFFSLSYKYDNWEIGTYSGMTYHHGWGVIIGYKIWEF